MIHFFNTFILHLLSLIGIILGSTNICLDLINSKLSLVKCNSKSKKLGIFSFVLSGHTLLKLGKQINKLL